RGKILKFSRESVELDDFVARQLTDTAYISRAVSQYLRQLGSRIVVPRGNMTAELRHQWGLNNILDPEKRGRKNRADHRHHAVDAIVIALTDTKRLNALASSRGKDMPEPWDGFRQAVERAIRAIHVSTRPQRGLSGALHEATLYGSTQKRKAVPPETSVKRPWAKDWIEDAGAYVRRKEVHKIENAKHLAKVRDLALRKILSAPLEKQGVDPGQNTQYPTGVFEGENARAMPSGVPIKRVRMIEEATTFRPVSTTGRPERDGQFVKPGNNHHIVYRNKESGQGKNTWQAEVVTMWEAARRGKAGLPLVERGEGFRLSLALGESFLIDDKDSDAPMLCVVRKIDQLSKRLFYRRHTDARKASEINKDNLYLSPKNMQERHARKVIIDPWGRLRWAND
ncbi:MAG: type II CRISPR RNA-guided endonuclease Cas9, partial [Planctomycetota bacterium]